MNNTKNVLNYFIGKGSISKLQSLINEKRVNTSDYAVILWIIFLETKVI